MPWLRVKILSSTPSNLLHGVFIACYKSSHMYTLNFFTLFTSSVSLLNKLRSLSSIVGIAFDFYTLKKSVKLKHYQLLAIISGRVSSRL